MIDAVSWVRGVFRVDKVWFQGRQREFYGPYNSVTHNARAYWMLQELRSDKGGPFLFYHDDIVMHPRIGELCICQLYGNRGTIFMLLRHASSPLPTRPTGV